MMIIKLLKSKEKKKLAVILNRQECRKSQLKITIESKIIINAENQSNHQMSCVRKQKEENYSTGAQDNGSVMVASFLFRIQGLTHKKHQQSFSVSLLLFFTFVEG